MAVWIQTSLEISGQQRCTYAAADEVDLFSAVDPHIKSAAVGYQETCGTRKRTQTPSGDFFESGVDQGNQAHRALVLVQLPIALSLTWNNDVSKTQDGELHPAHVQSPGREARDAHHHRQLGKQTQMFDRLCRWSRRFCTSALQPCCHTELISRYTLIWCVHVCVCVYES